MVALIAGVIMLEKEEILSRLQELRVLHDSRKTRIELWRQLQESEALHSVEEEFLGDHEVVSVVGTGNRAKGRKWPTVPAYVEKAVETAFPDGDPCFGSLYYDGEFVCSKALSGECEIGKWCRQVQDEWMDKQNDLSLKKAEITAPEILPENNPVGRHGSPTARAGNRQTDGPVARLAASMRTAFLESRHYVSIKESSVYDSYYRRGKLLFQIRVTAKSGALILMSEAAHDQFARIMEEQAADPNTKWVVKCYEMSDHEKSQHVPLTHKIKIKPFGMSASQARKIIDVFSDVHQF